VAGAVGELVQPASLAAGQAHLDRIWQPLAGSESLVRVSHHDRRASVVDVELGLGDRLVLSRPRVGKNGAQRLIAGASFGWVGEGVGALGRVPRGGDCVRHAASLRLVAVERIGGMPLADERQLPGEVEGVLQAAVHTVALSWRADVRRVPREQDATRPEMPMLNPWRLPQIERSISPKHSAPGVEPCYPLLDARGEERLEEAERLEDLEGAWMHHRRPVPVQRCGIGVDDAAHDPAAVELRREEQPGRACADHENGHIRGHVDSRREPCGAEMQGPR
jgi:hypothetical protein